jgi:N-acetylglucosamine-6-phosphate deacetylase
MTGFRNATVLIDGKLVKTSLVIKDGKIDGFYEADGQINLPEGAIVLPGFIDEHTHGAVGSDTMDANVADYKTIASQLVKEGTTAFLLTTMTASKEGIIDSIKAYNEFCSLPNDYATPVGIHLEGPFINPNKCGAQPKEYIAIPEIEAIKEYANLSNGSIKLITVAPEVDGALEFIKFCKSLGITLTAGHTSATYEEFVEYLGAFMGGGEIELSEDELAMVAGGKGLCFVIGGSNGPEADGHASIDGVEGHACYYVGIGIILPIIM